MCVRQGVTQPEDLDSVLVRELVSGTEMTQRATELLGTLAREQTRLGDERRRRPEAKQAVPTPEPKAPVPTALRGEFRDRPLAYEHRHSAVLAIVRLKAFQSTGTTSSFAAKGPMVGLGALLEAMDNGVGARAWTTQAIRDAVAGSAPASIGSACSALKWWAAFADQVLSADGHHLPPSQQGLAAWAAQLLFRASH